MNKTPITDIRELLKKVISTRDSVRFFKKLPAELVELLFTHFELTGVIENIKRSLPELPQMEALDTIIKNLEANKKLLIDAICILTDRKILLYTTLQDDTLWKISKKFGSEIHEISELNNIKDIILPAEKRLLLIPVKYSV